MTLPVWTVSPYTPLTLANIKIEFNGNVPVDISDYYSGSDDDLVGPGTIGYPYAIETEIPTEGNAIGISNFYGASQTPYTITTDKLIYNEGELITFNITAPDRSGSELFWTIENASVQLALNPSTIPSANRGIAYNTTITATGGVPPYTFSISHGALPAGISITPAGRISGVTVNAGNYLFNVIATDSINNTGNRSYLLKVISPQLEIIPTSLESGFVRVPYEAVLTVINGMDSYNWLITSGKLPDGLTLNSLTGIISGRPTTVGNETFRVTAEDPANNVVSRTYFLTINPVTIVINPPVLPEARQEFSYNQQLSAIGGKEPYLFGIVDTIPEGLTLSTSGLLSGTPVNFGVSTFTVRATDANNNTGERVYNLVTISNRWTIVLDGYGASPVFVNEGTNLTFTIKSPGTLVPNLTAYISISTPLTTNSSDVSISNDTVSIVNRNGTATVSVVADALTEGAEYFNVWVEYPRGTKVAEFGRINVVDSSRTPIFTANITPAVAVRGGPVTLSWNTLDAPPNSYVKVTRFNSVSTNDNTQYPTTGSKTYQTPTTGGTDGIGGGTWISQLELFSSTGTVITTLAPEYQVDTSTYSITPDKTSMFEGQTVTYQITTTNVPDGKVVHWINSGTTTAADFVDNQNSGTITINNNSATLTKVLSTDQGTLGTPTLETIIISLRSGSVTGPVLATASTVSVSNLQTFNITPALTIISPSTEYSANEGDTITWNIITTSVPNNTTLYWTNSGTLAAADFTDNTNSGTVVINNQAGSFTKTIKNDFTTETTESIIMQLRVGSVNGTIVATSSTINVADTSKTINEVITGPATTTADQPITITITGGVPNTGFSWTGFSRGSGTLDANGSYTFNNVSFAGNPAGTYNYNVVFDATGHTRTYQVVVTAVVVVPTFVNGSFESTSPVTQSGNVVSIPGWKIYLQNIRMNGFSTILGHPTPNDPTPSPFNAPKPYGDAPAVTGTQFSYSFVSESPSGTGGNVLRLLSQNGVTAQGYGILRGPYVISDSIILAEVGDTAEFWWKAQNGDDWFDVYAYLINETTGGTIELLNSTGNSTNWVKVSKVIAAGQEGTYRFVFISGSYDYSGGTVLGASLYIDDIKLIKA